MTGKEKEGWFLQITLIIFSVVTKPIIYNSTEAPIPKSFFFPLRPSTTSCFNENECNLGAVFVIRIDKRILAFGQKY